MVAVPVTTRRNVQTQPLERGALRYAESRNYVGPAVEQFGNAVSKASEEIDQVEATYDQADALNLDNTFAEELSATRTEFANLRGDQPGRELQDRIKAIDERAEQLVSGARSERARNIAKRAMSVRASNARAALTTHADNEMFKFRDTALSAARDQAANDAIGAVGTPQFAVAIGTGLTRVMERAKLLGSPDEALDLAKSEFLDEVHGGVIDTLLAVPDPDVDAITNYLDQYGGDMSATLRNKVLERLQGPLQGRMSRSDADLVLGFTVPTAGQEPVATPAAAAQPIAVDMLRDFEGFREGTYWDVNHHRVGYGSDTITTADGRVRPVKPSDRVSREDADRDLARRTAALEKTAASKAGAGWNTLPAGARAAVVSVAYNYGEGSDRLKPLWAAAARGDANAVADVIAGFAGDNGGLNKDRRLREAETARGNGTYATAPREWDKAQVYANLAEVAEREKWNPERTERARVELDKRISRDEGLLKDQQDEAYDTALNVVGEKGDAFRVHMIPSEVLGKMTPAQRRDLQDIEDKLTAPKPIKANGPDAISLSLMPYYEPEKFKTINLAQYAGRVTPAEIEAAAVKQAQMRNAPATADKWNPRSGIVTALNYGKKINAMDLEPEQEAAILGIMEGEAVQMHQANGGKPLTENDYQTLFRRATRNVETRGFFGGKGEKPRYELELSNMPDSQRARLTKRLKQSGLPVTDEALLRLYRLEAR